VTRLIVYPPTASPKAHTVGECVHLDEIHPVFHSSSNTCCQN